MTLSEVFPKDFWSFIPMIPGEQDKSESMDINKITLSPAQVTYSIGLHIELLYFISYFVNVLTHPIGLFAKLLTPVLFLPSEKVKEALLLPYFPFLCMIIILSTRTIHGYITGLVSCFVNWKIYSIMMSYNFAL